MERRLAMLVRSAARHVAPGLIEILDMHCKLKAGISVYEALLSNPQLVVETLVKIYSNTEAMRLVLREVFIKPVFSGDHDCHANYEELLDLLINKPWEFAKKLREILSVATTPS